MRVGLVIIIWNYLIGNGFCFILVIKILIYKNKKKDKDKNSFIGKNNKYCIIYFVEDVKGIFILILFYLY